MEYINRVCGECGYISKSNAPMYEETEVDEETGEETVCIVCPICHSAEKRE